MDQEDMIPREEIHRVVEKIFSLSIELFSIQSEMNLCLYSEREEDAPTSPRVCSN